jgi:uncharacterized protein YndB with AHSA1/START domain
MLSAMSSSRVERSITLPLPRDEVWAAMTHPDGLSEWFGASARFEKLENGARVEFRWPDGGTRAAIFEEVVAPGHLAFRWLPFETFPEGPRARLATRVEIKLSDTDSGCILTVVETDPREQAWESSSPAPMGFAAVVR